MAWRRRSRGRRSSGGSEAEARDKLQLALVVHRGGDLSEAGAELVRGWIAEHGTVGRIEGLAANLKLGALLSQTPPLTQVGVDVVHRRSAQVAEAQGPRAVVVAGRPCGGIGGEAGLGVEPFVDGVRPVLDIVRIPEEDDVTPTERQARLIDVDRPQLPSADDGVDRLRGRGE